MWLTLELHTFVGVLVGLQLSLMHCSRMLLPLKPPSLSLSGISVSLNGTWKLILSPHRQSYTVVDSFVEGHLTPDIHTTHIRAKVLPPGRYRSFLRPGRDLHRVLVHPLYLSGLLIVR